MNGHLNTRSLNKLLTSGVAACCLASFGMLTAAAQATASGGPGLAPFINSWLVCGPFDQAVAADKSASAVGAALGDRKWEYLDDRLWNRNYDNYVDLFGYYTVRKGIDTRNKYIYARASVFSPADQPAEFRFGTSGTCRLFINGTMAMENTTPKEVHRDMFKQNVALTKDWNSILLEIRHDFTADKNDNGVEIAKDASVSYLGLYGRISDTHGKQIPGLIYSVIGGGTALSVDSQPLAADDVVEYPSAKGRGLPANALPNGYVEWPYIWNRSLYGLDNRRIWADPYQFQASGGQPGYTWKIVAGGLPDGLTLMRFGIYYATEGGGLGHHSTDVFVQNCSDLIRRYDPHYLYFDGPQTMKGANYDVMYSNVRNYGADIIINSNVSHHFIKGPDGKMGYTGEASVTISPVNHRVQQVIWLNANQPLKFQQTGESLTITLQGITADPVDTIVKIITDNPARKYHLTHIAATGKQLSPSTLEVAMEGWATYPALKIPFARDEVRFTSSDAAIAMVDHQGLVTAMAPGKAAIRVEGRHHGVTVEDTLNVIVDSSKRLRVDDTLIGVVLKVGGKEAYLACSGTAALPFTLEGRSQKGGPIALHSAGITIKSGVVDYTKGTHHQPVFIAEKPVFTASGDQLTPIQADELTRTAVWAEIDLDGVKTTSNKVFIDLHPKLTLTTPTTAIVASGHLGDCTPNKVNDGDGIRPDGTDLSKWSAPGKEPSWIAFDLGKEAQVSEVEILFNSLEQHYINTPDTMEIQASGNALEWTTLAVFTPPANGKGAFFGFTDTFPFKPVKTRYLRLSFPKGNSKGDSVDLLEVKIKRSLASNLAMAAKVTASSAFNDAYSCVNRVIIA